LDRRNEKIPRALLDSRYRFTYWTLFYVFIFHDLYLAFRSAGFLLKRLAPFVLIAHLIGVGLGLASWPRCKALASMATALNALPFIGLIGFVWWLWFGVKI